MENYTMATDKYELTMAQIYFNEKRFDEIAYFDGYFRTNPFGGSYTIMGGLYDMIEYLENFHFDEEDISYLESLGQYSKDFLEYLKNMRFTGDLYAIPDGTAVFPNETCFMIRANIIEAQIVETALLACFNHGCLVTTKAKRITNEAQKIPVWEFSSRRDRGIGSSIDVGRLAYIGGCAGTSNVYGGKKFGIPTFGTMAHSFVQSYSTEYDAFLAFAKTYPEDCLFLVDTYDTLKSGIPNAIRVSREYLEPRGYRLKGIRIDSGDLVFMSKAAREMLDFYGYSDVGICLSNGLDEYSIENLLKNNTPVNSFGVGDNLGASKERVNGVYKLAALEYENVLLPKIKISGDSVKTTNPGVKKVYRFYDHDSDKILGDVICRDNEKSDRSSYLLVSSDEPWRKIHLNDYSVRNLLMPIFIGGQLVYKKPSLTEARDYCNQEFSTLSNCITSIHTLSEYPVYLSEEEKMLKEEMLLNNMIHCAEIAKENLEYQKKYVKRG